MALMFILLKEMEEVEAQDDVEEERVGTEKARNEGREKKKGNLESKRLRKEDHVIIG